MEEGYMLIVKFGGRGLAKQCSSTYTREELVIFLRSKWDELVGSEIFISYECLGCGELDLVDEQDMRSMFRLLKELQAPRVKIFVKRLGDWNGKVDSGAAGVAVKEVNDASEGSGSGVLGSSLIVVGLPEAKRSSHDWKNMIIGPGQCFVGGAVEFRKALVKYSVEVGFDFRFLRNAPDRVSAVCRLKDEKGCRWRIVAVRESSDDSFRVSTYERNHTCGLSFDAASRKRVTYQIVSDLIVEDIRAMPDLNPIQVQALLKKNFGIDISYAVAWRAMEKGRSVVFGDHTTSFAKLPAYFDELLKANPGSHVHLDVGGDRKFVRCFFSFEACIVGFLHCRPMLMVDGTFLKGRHKGVLLSAVEKDGDEGLFPLAFAVVNEETDDNWQYFFRHLKVIVGEGRKLVFVSDRNHGILRAVREVFEGCPHAYCYNHLKSNLEYRCRGLGKKIRGILLKVFQNCAYATSEEQYLVNEAKLRNVGGPSVEAFLRDMPKEMWANAYFVGDRYGQMTSNACESWNSQIREERLLPITSMIDGIRVKLMQQICSRRQQAQLWVSGLCKSIDMGMRMKVDQARGSDVRKASEDIWEVFSVPAAVVDLKHRTCSCRMWQLNSLPCVHAVAIVCLSLNRSLEFVEWFFHIEAYKATYAKEIVPFGVPVGNRNDNLVLAPIYHQTRGRPKRRRIASQREHIPRKMKYGNCGELSNHNRKTCRSRGCSS